MLTPSEAANEASMSGFNQERYNNLYRISGQPPGAEQLLEMWNRGILGEGSVDEGLRQSRLRPEWVDPVKALRNVLVPVSDLIRFAVREVFNPPLRSALDLDAEYPEALTARAHDLGLSEQNAREYWAAHWNLPSREEGAQMLFRGELTPDQYDGLLKALDYAPTWRGKLTTITRAIPPISDMIRFAVREVYDPAKRNALGLDAEYPAEFTAQAHKHGMQEQDARDYWAAHWRLPSAQQGYRMLWRGEINPAQLDELLKALDYPTLWRDRLANIAHLVPGRVDLRRMLAAGVIDRAEVLAGYKRLGYTEKDAETLTKFAEQAAASGGHTSSKWADRAKSSLFTVTKREYLDESIDQAGANDALDVIGVPQAERAAIFAAWDKENAIGRKELTTAQITKAYKAGGLTHDDAIARLVDTGVTLADAELILNPSGI